MVIAGQFKVFTADLFKNNGFSLAFSQAPMRADGTRDGGDMTPSDS